MSVFQKKLSALPCRRTGFIYRHGILPLEGVHKKSNTVLTRRMLLEKLWELNGIFVDEHALTAAVSRVRGKIEANGYQYIKTVYGMGYMWIGGQKK